ncbi:GNAT family N-acetyltransferase [Pelagimonas varians]|uniref:Acetyltransferase (GNAT) family protein n=1 Tax=Pelagimonas varians TaxID=696760 RepID=A0A238L6N8_9RHOB|nr:GNAT family N-acetyltransferase [Pelagimonas varians]PYG25012.1 acetyltransferase (GNAT) family protein [Pelagimonas varians]SMX50667.1 Acetyltransferase (GNAT) family protein [Pelagimonas varians]
MKRDALVDISEQFRPGSLGAIVMLHGNHYASNWGFGTFFEAKVALELAEFAARQASDDLVLIAHDCGGVAASLVLDLNDPTSGPRGGHLRWFICAERCRGTGLGRQILQRAVSHSEAHSKGNIWLTTFAGLKPARHLYESFGFELVSEAEGTAWGTTVKEQEFRR